ncbi:MULTISPECIES: OmpA family protein [Marinobacter]|uniref:Cell envelope biogenesis protein OmpA n=1 Tax=Marinobacter profundi TaxID=2666256 RepID=A0A2G1UIF1_9GAMM|nr:MULTISPECIES: OmpA family protein [Marinobacter]MBD3655174.1 OmpA family protein [Marinobacter sp.]PHQ14281.1 cell envelope biogenesis protein OmpA [Marinobacter profundi]
MQKPRKTLYVAVAGALLAGAGSSVLAESVQHTSEFTLMGVYIEPDEDRTDEYGTAVRALYGIRLDRHWWLEPQFYSGVIETGVAGGTDYYQQGLGVDLAYRFFADASFTPYALIGGGVSRNDVANNRSSEFGGFANAGLGVMTSPLTQSGIRLRGDARYLYDSFDDNFSDLHFSLGVTVPIGATRTQIVEKTTVIEKPIVVEQGFADSDNDGVVDGVDQCPNTLEGLEVDSVGCVKTDQKQTVVLRGVTFEFNSNRLTANAKDILVRAGDALKGQPDMKVELAGHTDSVGAEAYNQQLSQQRADAVRDYLIDLGVEPDQLTARGYGESQPIRSNDTDEGRERNRRVEFNVVSE